MTKAKVFSKVPSSKTKRILLITLLILIVIPVILIGGFIASFDVNSYRGKLETLALEQTGRTIKLAGPIEWSFSFGRGLSLAVSDITISNPSWASRPDMAHVGKAKLHLDVTDLMQKKVSIVAFELADSDVQLESNNGGATNWDFSKPATDKKEAAKKEAPEKTAEPKEAAPVDVDVKEIKITDSRFGMKGGDGKLSLFEVPELLFKNNGKNITLHYKGSLAGTPSEIDLEGGPLSGVMQDNWPFSMQAIVATMKLDARGTLSGGGRKIEFEEYEFSAGASDLSGKMTIITAGPRPVLQGTAQGKLVNLDDLKMPASQAEEAKAAKQEAAEAEEPKKIFNRRPIALDGLKAVDAHLDVTLDELVLGMTSVQNLKTKLDLEAGRLTLPVTGTIAGSKASAAVKINAASFEPQIAIALKANDLDMSQLFKMGGLQSFISGKSHVDIDVTTSGKNTHAYAANANGKVNLVMDTGTISSSMMGDIASGLVMVFAPGVGALTKPGLKCLAARYVITNGLMETKGMLADTDMTTIAGAGYVNLPDEHISMSLYTKPKGLGLGSMIPPMRVTGDLSKPSFTPDAADAAQKVVGLLTNSKQTASGVPNLVTIAGKNTCDATLDNPNAPDTTTPSAPLIPDSAKDIENKVKDVGGELLKGIGGGVLWK